MAAELAEGQGVTVEEWKRKALEKNNYEPDDGSDD
jgi:hypothetical protein